MREAGATEPHQLESTASRRFHLGCNCSLMSPVSAPPLPACSTRTLNKGSSGLERGCSIPRRQPPLPPNCRRESLELESGGSSN